MAHRVATSCCLARATWRRKASSQFYRQLLRARHAHQMMPGASYSSDSKLTTGRGLLDRDLGQPSHFTHPSLIGEEEVLPGMHKREFAERRERLMQEIAKTHSGMTNLNHLVIIPGAPVVYMSQDVFYPFHQNPDLLYLTGYQEPDAVLVLEGSGAALPSHKSTLYVRPRDLYRELWDGPRPGPDGAQQLTGVDEAHPIDMLEKHLESYSSKGYSVWYYTKKTVNPACDEVVISSLTKSQESHVMSVHDISHQLQTLRVTKSPSEIALMKKAGQISSIAFKECIKSTCPGMNESEVEARMEYWSKKQGARRLSFVPVVAGGSKANVLHNVSNNRELKAGDLVLVDAGCDYHGYMSDITRTWPVDGKFTAAQKDLYEIVLAVKDASIKACRSGISLNFLHSAAVDMLANELTALGIIPKGLSKSEVSQSMGELLPHHLGHFLGMDVHDCMEVDRNVVLEPGMVATIEPGVYITEKWSETVLTKGAKELAGTGIRIEDDVVITESGCEVLNTGCPQTISELEK